MAPWWGLLSLIASATVSAQTPSAVFAPESFREAITAPKLEALGLHPDTFEVTIPLSPGLTLTQKTVTVGEKGFLSTGIAQHDTTELTYAFSSTGSLKFFRDAATVATPMGDQRSSVIRVNLDQGFGSGAWAGKLSLAHEDSSNSGTFDGHSESQSDSINLSMGLGNSASLVASASVAETLNAAHTRTEKQDVIVTSLGTAVAEYHHSKVRTNGLPIETTQIALRTPPLKIAELATLSASHVQNESSVTGTERIASVNLATPISQVQVAATFLSADRPTGPESVTTVNLSAKPSDKVDISANLLDASRPTGEESVHSVTIAARPSDNLTVSANHTSAVKPGIPETKTTVVSSNLKVTDEVAVAANVNSTTVEGTGTTTVTAVDVASVPQDGCGLSVKAGVVDTQTPQAEVDPTIHLQLDYTTKNSLTFSGSYHQAAGLVASEVLSAFSLPLLGGKLSANYAQRTTTPNVIPSRSIGMQYVRPVGWGLTGTLNYDVVTNLQGLPLKAWGLKVALSGENRVVGKIDLQYNTGTVRNPLGGVSDCSGIALSIARPIHDLGSLSLSVKHIEMQFFPDDDQIRLDATVNW